MSDPQEEASLRELALPDEAATQALGERLARLLEKGDLIALAGPLGAGKTTLARALLRQAAGEETLEVPSPTFTLVQTYATPALEIWHVDLYRLEGPGAVDELGLEEGLEAGALLVEWPDRAGGRLGGTRLDVRLEMAGAGRLARLAAHGSWKERLVHV